jgi:hypothetical protein
VSKVKLIMTTSYTYTVKRVRPTGTGIPRQVKMQDGGLSLGDVGHSIKKAWDWAKKNKLITKIDEFVDKVAPAQIKSSPYYQGFKRVTNAAKQAGFGTKQMSNGVMIVHAKPKTRARRVKKNNNICIYKK